MISYCSKECQVKDWKNHKGFCVGFVLKVKGRIKLLVVTLLRKLRKRMRND